MADISNYIPYPVLPVVASATTEILKLCGNCQILSFRPPPLDALVTSLDVQIISTVNLPVGLSRAIGEVKLCVLSVSLV